MRRTLICIASAAAAALAGTASAAMTSAGGAFHNVGLYNHGTPLVQDGHHRGATWALDHGIAAGRLAAAGEDACRAAEPSKLGLLRSTRPAAGSSTAARCRKLKA
jgi:hypothetical protein